MREIKWMEAEVVDSCLYYVCTTRDVHSGTSVRSNRQWTAMRDPAGRVQPLNLPTVAHLSSIDIGICEYTYIPGPTEHLYVCTWQILQRTVHCYMYALYIVQPCQLLHTQQVYRANRFPKTWLFEHNKADLPSCGSRLVEAGFVFKYRTAGGGVDLLRYPKWLKNNCILDCNNKVPWIAMCITITMNESLRLLWLEHVR